MSSPRRVDGLDKLIGRTRYLDDYPPANGELEGWFAHAGCDHGRIRSISYPQGFDLSEFTIVSATDIPGANLVPEPEPDQPFFAEGEVQHMGQPILAAAHPSRHVVRAFTAAVTVDYEELEAITDVDECLDDSTRSFGRQLTMDYRDGGTEAGTRGESTTVSEIYRTAHQEQAYLEPQAVIADFHPDTRIMHITQTLQCPYYVKEAVQSIMGSTVRDVVVRASEGIGGAFGGKEDYPNVLAGIAALLSYTAGKPVRMVMDRSLDVLLTPKRHPSRVEITTVVDRGAASTKRIELDYRLDAGAYQTLSPVVLSRGVLHACGGYRRPRAHITGALHRSNTPPNGAFRGFGAPQAFFAIESHMDDIAAVLGLDPYEIRARNLFRTGDHFPTGQVVEEDHLRDCLEHVVRISDFRARHAEYEGHAEAAHGAELRGIGLSVGFHGAGFTGNGERVLDSEVAVRLDGEGWAHVLVSSVDMGQGAYTTLAQMASEALGHPLDRTVVHVPDTSVAPNSGPTVASRTIYIVGAITEKLCAAIRAELGGNVAAALRESPGSFPLERTRRFQPESGSARFDEERYVGPAYRHYSWVACVTEIRVDLRDYRIHPVTSWNVLDIGRVINHDIAVGQVHGGVVQALGYALTEQCYRRGHGRSRGFTDYVLPTSLDVPDIEVEFIHTDSRVAKGLGEVPMNCPAASVRNALRNATGSAVNTIPLTPEVVMRALESAP